MYICSKGNQQSWHLVGCFQEEKESVQREYCHTSAPQTDCPMTAHADLTNHKIP